MKGVILSGGKGSRLAPITDEYPKQLVPILGKPILFHCIEYLTKANITEIGIVVSPETGKIIERAVLEADLKAKFTFIYQDEPRGLAHAVGITRDFTGDDDFAVLLGDNLFEKDLFELVSDFKKNQSSSLILLKEVDRPYQFGVAKFDNSGKVQKLVEKPKHFVSNYAIVGVYLFNKEIFEAIGQIKPSGRGELEITDAISMQVELKQNVTMGELTDYWFDTGTREGLLNANKVLILKNRQNFIFDRDHEDGNHIIGEVHIGKNCSIKNSIIMGPAFISDNCKIENSRIGPFTSISANVEIKDSLIHESIVMPDSKLDHANLISCVLGNESIFEGDSSKPKDSCINKLISAKRVETKV